jgi:hypothetical protein
LRSISGRAFRYRDAPSQGRARADGGKQADKRSVIRQRKLRFARPFLDQARCCSVSPQLFCLLSLVAEESASRDG